MLTIMLIVLIFGLLVLTHEFGHFLSARRNGVEVEEFGIGFPPKVWGFKRKGTLYSVNLLPLGGFVRMKGESSDDTRPHSFGAASFKAKTKILLAGVGMNLLTAYLVVLALCLTGLPPFLPGQENLGHPTYSQPKQLMVAAVDPGSPAARAGIKQGDIVLSGDGQNFIKETDLTGFTHDHAGQTVRLAVQHHGQTNQLDVRLRDPDSKAGFLGVIPVQVYQLRYPLADAFWVAAWLTLKLSWLVVAGVVMLLIHLPALVAGLFKSGAVPDAAESTSGPVGIFFILQSLVQLGPAYIGLFVANVAAALAVFNVLPIPALDGGRFAILAVQQAFGKKMSARVETIVHTAGFVFLIALMVIITVYDFRKR